MMTGTKGQDFPLLRKKDQRTINAMVDLGQEEPGDVLNALVSRALTLCPLPYRKPKESKITRSVRLPQGSLLVTFSNPTSTNDLPYGDDALILDLLASEARRRKTRVITFRTAKDLLEFAGLKPDARGAFGGKDFKEILQRVNRLRRLSIGIEWNAPDGAGDPLEIWNVFSKSLTPSTEDAIRERQGEVGLFPYFLEFGEQFFNELMSHYRAIPREVLIQFKGNPTEYSLAKFLVDRVATAKTTTTIPLAELREERGSGDSNLARFRQQLRNVLVKLSAWDPDFHPDRGKVVTLTPKGLRIGPIKKVLIVENPEK